MLLRFLKETHKEGHFNHVKGGNGTHENKTTRIKL